MNSGVVACFMAVAMAAIAWLWGPPCSPGNTDWLILFSRSYMTFWPLAFTERTPLRKKMMPARGPRSVLCVVVVTISQYSNGLGMTPKKKMIFYKYLS